MEEGLLSRGLGDNDIEMLIVKRVDRVYRA